MKAIILSIVTLAIPSLANGMGMFPPRNLYDQYYHVHRCPVGYHRIEGRCKMILPRRNGHGYQGSETRG